MEIRQLRTLLAIVNTGSFASAAKAVGLTQSAVSQQVRALETELQIALFDRIARPVSLTLEGRTLLEQARRIVALCDETAVKLKGEPLTGVLNLGVLRGSMMGTMPGALAMLRRRYPGLKVLLSTGDLVDLVANVKAKRMDAALVPEVPTLDAQLSWLPYFVEPFMAIAPLGTPGATDSELLEARPFIQFSRTVRSGRMIAEEIERRGIKVQTEMEIDSFPAIVMMVQEGLGVAVAPSQSIGSSQASTIRARPFGAPVLTRTIGIVARRANPKAALVAALHDALGGAGRVAT